MTEGSRRGAGRRRLPSARRLAPLVLLAGLGAALLVPPIAPVRLADPDRTAAARFEAGLDRLPDDALVLLAFDPDFGTYGEIRFTVRAVIDELLEQGARLAFVSFTPEGRALALAELERLERLDAPPRRVADFGFRSGAEAALLLAVEEIVPPRAEGPVAEAVEAAGEGLGAFDMAMIVAGNDLGPRVWVEQVWPRVPDLTLAAIAPTYLRAELQPYLASGQLAALLGTLRESARYLDAVGASDELEAGETPPSGLAILVGTLVALGVLAQGLADRLLGGLRGAWRSRR